MTRAFLLLLAALAVVHGEEIKPPFGLPWGYSKEDLAPLLTKANAKVVEKRVVSPREVWTVEGLVQKHLKRTLFYFRGDELDEIEMQYQDAAWIDSDYRNFLNQLRMSLESKYGEGRLVARSKTTKGEIMQSMTGYEWVQSRSAVLLIYFSAETTAKVYRVVSLHYKSMPR